MDDLHYSIPEIVKLKKNVGETPCVISIVHWSAGPRRVSAETSGRPGMLHSQSTRELIGASLLTGLTTAE